MGGFYPVLPGPMLADPIPVSVLAGSCAPVLRRSPEACFRIRFKFAASMQIT